MHPKLKSIFDSRYAAPLTMPWKLIKTLTLPCVRGFQGSLDLFVKTANDNRDRSIFSKYSDALMDSNDAFTVLGTAIGLTGGIMAALVSIIAIPSAIAALSWPLIPSIVFGAIAIPTAVALTVGTGALVGPVLTAGAATLAAVGISIGLAPAAALWGVGKTLASIVKKAPPPPAPPPAPPSSGYPGIQPPQPWPDPPSPSPVPTPAEQVQRMTPEERRAFFEEMKGAFADEFEKVANPPAWTPLDVVPVYADLGHGKKRPPTPPSTPPAQEP